MQTYEEMLKHARSQLPAIVQTAERFDIPKVKGHVQGNKTIISNYGQICDLFSRPQEHLLKFLQRELATPAQIDGPRIIFGRKLNSPLINAKIAEYANVFVICSECRKPDTVIQKEGSVPFMRCSACGAKHPIKTKI